MLQMKKVLLFLFLFVFIYVIASHGFQDDRNNQGQQIAQQQMQLALIQQMQQQFQAQDLQYEQNQIAENEILEKKLRILFYIILPQITVNLANVILPGYVFFDKAIILVWTRCTLGGLILLIKTNPIFHTPVNIMKKPISKLLVAMSFLVANFIMVSKSSGQLQNLNSMLEENSYGEHFRENLEFQIALYPHTNGDKALIITWPFIIVILHSILDIFHHFAGERPERKTPLWSKACGICTQIPNMFLPAFLPRQLFIPLFTMGALDPFLASYSDLVLMFNVFAYVNFHTAVVDWTQLGASFILLGIYALINVLLFVFKRRE